MAPLVLALIDAVLALAYHHDDRARRGLSFDHEAIRVHASVHGPAHDGVLEFRLTISATPRSQEREVSEHTVRFTVDPTRERLSLTELSLGEPALDRTSFAALLGALEVWCCDRIPLARDP